MKKRETNYEKTTIKRKTTNFSNVGIQERKKNHRKEKKKHKILTQINLKKEREKNHHT